MYTLQYLTAVCLFVCLFFLTEVKYPYVQRALIRCQIRLKTSQYNETNLYLKYDVTHLTAEVFEPVETAPRSSLVANHAPVYAYSFTAPK